MDKSIITHTDQYFIKLKTDIQKKAIELSFNEKDKLNELLEFIFEYEKISFNKDIFTKKKNNKTSGSEFTQVVFSDEERCIAQRKQGDRCSRKRVKGNLYCGTHCVKNNPLTISEQLTGDDKEEEKKKSINIKEKKYNKKEIIAKAVQLSHNAFSIPSLGL